MFHIEHPVESDRFEGNIFEAVPFWECEKGVSGRALLCLQLFSRVAGKTGRGGLGVPQKI
jgi:hypothetical protein